MSSNLYSCICGKTFPSVRSLCGHYSHCEVYNLAKYGNLDILNKHNEAYLKAHREKEKKLNDWLNEEHTCEHCGKVMVKYYGSGRFCSKTCATSRTQTPETIKKIKLSTISANKRLEVGRINKYEQSPKFCRCCGSKIPYKDRHRLTCSDECAYKLKVEGSHIGGKQSANRQVRRSKNEIAFCEMCEEYFGKENVLHNVPMFNGWDADIIVTNLKLAILWNGPWHYRKVTKTHNLKQVQNRDRIKLNEIVRCGFEPYIIKDVGKGNKMSKVLEEFEKLKQYLSTEC